MNHPTPQGLPVRDLTDDEKQFLHYNPNTSDLVEFVQAYAREALAAQAATLESIHKIIECAGPEAADEIADLLGYPSVEWPSDMSQQPKALRLADLCRSGALINDERDDVANELRRLHAVESGAKVELMRRDNLIDSLHGLCESYRTQVESLEADPRIGKCQACGHECEVCHSQNASQTPQTGLSLTAAPQEWSPAYTRGPARQSAPVAAVPALVPLSVLQYNQIPALCQIRPSLYESVVRAIEAASAKLNGLTVGDGAQPIKDTP